MASDEAMRIAQQLCEVSPGGRRLKAAELIDAALAKRDAEIASLNGIIANEARDWAELHDFLLAATGTVVDDAGQPTCLELARKLLAATKCSGCGKHAVCVGEGVFCCDDCCTHDGVGSEWCHKITKGATDDRN